MLARRVASVARTSSRAAFSTSTLVKKDFVQDLYLRELKAYKPKDIAANAHVGQVKEFHSPSAPSAPVIPSSADLAKELDAYEKEEVSTAPPAAPSADADADATAGQSADEYLAFVEKEAQHKPAAAHH